MPPHTASKTKNTEEIQLISSLDVARESRFLLGKAGSSLIVLESRMQIEAMQSEGSLA